MQSVLTWQIHTFVVSLHVVSRCVGHADADVHDVPSVAIPHCGYVPVPSPA